MTSSNICEAAAWSHLMHPCLHREQETVCSILCDTCLFLSINTWGQCWVATEASDPVPLLHGPQHGALLLCQQCSALHLSPSTQSGLWKSIPKCQGKASPLRAITEGYLGDLVLVCVCVCFRIPRIIGIQGETNGWLAELAWSIPSVTWKRPKPSH